eukprot:gene21081-23137_t
MCVIPPRIAKIKLNVGTLNVRGLNSDAKKQHVANDMNRYQLSILAIQETKLKESGVIDIKTSDGKQQYDLYYTGSVKDKYHGVGIVTEKGLNAEFKTISNRTCMATIRLEEKKIIFIATYAPTLDVSEKKPAIRDEYYQELESVISTVSKRDILIIGGDQNAKLGTGHEEYPEAIGHYGKGEINSNGQHLAEICTRNGLGITDKYHV